MKLSLGFFGFLPLMIIGCYCYSPTVLGLPLSLEPGKGEYPLGKHLEVLEDQEKLWDLSEITSSKGDLRFKVNHDEIINEGFSKSAYWVRFSVKNLTEKSNWILEYGRSYMDKIELYQPVKTGGYLKIETGDLIPFNSREISHRNFLFSLNLEPGETKQFYLRFESQGSMVIPLKLWSLKSFYEKDQIEQVILGIYYGLIGVMILYNLFLFVSLKDRSYFYYVFYVFSISMTISISNGLAFQFLWPESPWLQNNAMKFLIGMTDLGLLLFTRKFLDTKSNVPRADRALFYLIYVVIFVMLAGLFISNRAFSVFYPGQLILTVTVIYAGITCLRKNHRPARFFVTAFSLTLIGMLISTLRIVGYLPEGFLTFHNIQIASAIEAVLLSIALADRINILKQEMLDTQEKLLDQIRKEDRYKSELNAVLEQKVIERTAEIERTNALLLEEIARHKHTEGERYLLSTAVNQAAESVFITSADGRFEYVNPAFEGVFQTTKKEIIGQHYRDLLQKHVQLDSEHQLYKELQSGKSWKGHLAFAQSSNVDFEGEVAISPVLGDSKNISSYVGIIHDLTEKFQLEKQLRQSQKMESLGTLAGGIAHDFNNILGTMQGFTELLIKENQEKSEHREYLEEIHKAGRRATDLVRQILAFSRADEGKFESLWVQTLIKDNLNMVRSILPATIKIQQNIDFECPPIKANKTQIEQILINLSSNSAYAMKNTGGVLTINLKEIPYDQARSIAPHLKKGNFVKLSIGDTGKGIDPAIADRIFDPFFTTKGIGEGSGLGLSVVHGIIQNHNGEIILENKPGMGAIFHLLFPATDEVPQVKHVDEKRPPGGKEHILIVEDEIALARFYQIFLQKQGFQTTVFNDSLKALAAIRKNLPLYDLLLTDQTMPNLTGEELSQEILKIKPGFPIILTTGYSNTISEKEAKAIGIEYYMLKPVKLNKLRTVIRSIFDKD